MSALTEADDARQAFARIDWRQPWLAPLAERGARWQAAALAGYAPYLAALNADARSKALATGRGEPLSFIAQDDLPPDASYEGHIAATGCVPTRHNLHDFFNASMWFQYPRIKAALNALQAAQIEALGIGPTRGGVRDALTLFDENAVLFACADPRISGRFARLRLADAVSVKTRRVERALRGARLRPRAAGKAVVALQGVHGPRVDRGSSACLLLPSTTNNAGRCSTNVSRSMLLSRSSTSRDFAPLPVLGVPGWWPANESSAFYADATVFRPGRRNRR